MIHPFQRMLELRLKILGIVKNFNVRRIRLSYPSNIEIFPKCFLSFFRKIIDFPVGMGALPAVVYLGTVGAVGGGMKVLVIWGKIYVSSCTLGGHQTMGRDSIPVGEGRASAREESVHEPEAVLILRQFVKDSKPVTTTTYAPQH